MSAPSLTEGGRSVHSEDWGWRLQPRDPEPHVLPEGTSPAAPNSPCPGAIAPVRVLWFY